MLAVVVLGVLFFRAVFLAGAFFLVARLVDDFFTAVEERDITFSIHF